MSLQPIVPIILLVLVAVPLLVLTATLAIRSTRSGSTTGHAQARSWWLRFAMLALLTMIGLGPSVPQTSTEATMSTIDVFFVVDRTGSMAAEDYNGTDTRLSGVKADMLSIVDNFPGARFSIISFDSQAARQLPLTTDGNAVESWAETTDRELSYRSRGSLLDRPLDELDRALSSSAEQHPDNIRLVFFCTDGEQTAKGERASYADLAPLIGGGAVLGYGTTEGGKMKNLTLDANGSPTEQGYVKDPTKEGSPDGVSKMDPEQLAAIASELGIVDVKRTAPGLTADLVGTLDAAQIAADGSREISTYQPVLWPLATLLTALLAVELWGMGRRLGQKVGI